jgi:hypothetical protein
LPAPPPPPPPLLLLLPPPRRCTAQPPPLHLRVQRCVVVVGWGADVCWHACLKSGGLLKKVDLCNYGLLNSFVFHQVIHFQALRFRRLVAFFPPLIISPTHPREIHPDLLCQSAVFLFALSHDYQMFAPASAKTTTTTSTGTPMATLTLSCPALLCLHKRIPLSFSRFDFAEALCL